MTDRFMQFRLADFLALFAVAMTSIAGIGALAMEGRANSGHPPLAIVSNGIITSTMANAGEGLEISSNAPGMITVTSGSNSVNLRGDYVTLSGAVTLAPGATPGVTVMPNAEGGYTVTLDPPTEFDLGK